MSTVPLNAIQPRNKERRKERGEKSFQTGPVTSREGERKEGEGEEGKEEGEKASRPPFISIHPVSSHIPNAGRYFSLKTIPYPLLKAWFQLTIFFFEKKNFKKQNVNINVLSVFLGKTNRPSSTAKNKVVKIKRNKENEKEKKTKQSNKKRLFF